MESTVLRCTTGGHNKEYRIQLSGVRVDLFWGKIGATMQSQTKMFSSARAARDFAKEKEWEKMQKGYTLHAHIGPEPDRYISPQFLEDVELMSAIEKS